MPHCEVSILLYLSGKECKYVGTTKEVLLFLRRFCEEGILVAFRRLSETPLGEDDIVAAFVGSFTSELFRPPQRQQPKWPIRKHALACRSDEYELTLIAPLHIFRLEVRHCQNISERRNSPVDITSLALL